MPKVALTHYEYLCLICSSHKFTIVHNKRFIRIHKILNYGQNYGFHVLLSNQIAGLLDDKYLSKESEKLLGFSFRNTYPGEKASKTTPVGLG